MNLRKVIYVLIGLLGLVLGAIGAVLPMLPAFPFLMLAAFCFARSSERLDRWFRTTSLYKKHLEDYVSGRGMTWRTKIRVMLMITLLMSVGFIMMGRRGIIVGCAVLAGVWLFHILYFCLGVKTISGEARSD